MYLRARWYDPTSGTFLTKDPFAGFPRQPYSLHPYQYGYSNPLRWTDPTGQCVFTGIDTIVCGALALTIYEAMALIIAAGSATYATYDGCVTRGGCDRLAADLEHALQRCATVLVWTDCCPSFTEVSGLLNEQA